MLQPRSGLAILRKVSPGGGSPELLRRVREAVMGTSIHTQRRFKQEVYVHQFFQAMKGFVAVAALTALVAGMTPAAHAQAKEKKYKDNAEYDIFNEVTKDLNPSAPNFTKAITDLDTWKQKYPDSDFKDTRAVLYLTAYSGAKQFNKEIAAAGEILSQDLDTVYADPKQGPRDVLTILYTTAVAIQQIPNPTPAEIATGEKAAKLLMNFNRKPEGLSDADWNNTKNQLQTAAKGALLFTAVVPGNQAMTKQPPDCETAQSIFAKALSDYPDNAFVSYQLGRAWYCIARANPSKVDEYGPKGIYEFVRAIAIDPTLGGTQDAKKLTDSVTSIYNTFHGGNDGFEQLKQTAKASPLPPPGFTIENSQKVAERKAKEFQEKYPQLAMWLNIKSQLAGPEGEQYFASSMKDAKIPKLKGVVVEGTPACRSKELKVAVPEPEEKGAPLPVITLKPEKPLTGKPEAGSEIQFEGVPTAFSKDPFMLTMEQVEIEGLKTSPCAATPARAPAKKGVPSKKK